MTISASLPGAARHGSGAATTRLWTAVADPGALSPLADLVCASAEEAAERARAALSHALRHDALVIVAPASDGLPVRIAASADLHERLASIDWSAIATAGAPYQKGVDRFAVPDVIAGLQVAGWAASSAGVEVLLLVLSAGRLEIGPAQEQAARLVTMLTAARQRGIGQAPSPGTLAFSYALSQERDRIRWELASSHAATLAALLKALRDTQNGLGVTPPGLAMAIDLASQALLEVKASAQRHDASVYIHGTEAFARTEQELREIARTAGLRLISGFEGPPDGMLPQALARAGRVVCGEAALNATRRHGADKLRLHWRITGEDLGVTVADNGDGLTDDERQMQGEWSHLVRMVTGLGGTVQVDTAPDWGTTVNCRLPLHALSLVPETPAAGHIAQLRRREREVLELMVAGLRNREIAQRLDITVRTVKFHVSNILRKFGAQSRAEVIVLAHNAGITGPCRP